MFGRSRNDDEAVTTRSHREIVQVDNARGGVAFGPVLTGVVVAFGAMFLMLALVGGVLVTTGVASGLENDAVEAGLAAGMALVIAQLLAYLWGGYTAGRMSRGAGALNGLLVPLVAIIVAVIVGAIATGLGESANLNLPFTVNRLPLESDLLVDWGVGIGIASLVAMFFGGLLGGALGERWHTRLERRVHEERVEEVGHPTTTDRTAEQREIDLRENDRRENESARPAGTTETPLEGRRRDSGTVDLR